MGTSLASALPNLLGVSRRGIPQRGLEEQMKWPRLAWAFLPGGISCPPLPRCAGIRLSLSWLAGSHTLGQGQYCQCFFKDLGLKQPWA